MSGIRNYQRLSHRGNCCWQFTVNFAEAGREFISMRTKQGLEAARASGKKLGRPKGSRDKKGVLDLYREQNKRYLYLGL